MKNIIPLLLASYMITFACCKKTIDRQIEDYVISLLTSGDWFLQLYAENGIDFTSDFAGYKFNFFQDGRMEASKGATTSTGTWSGDLTNKTFTSAFPGSGFPLNKLNQTWKITDKYIDVIYAEVQTSAGLVTIRFRKL
jgi:hypothetical protein